MRNDKEHIHYKEKLIRKEKKQKENKTNKEKVGEKKL